MMAFIYRKRKILFSLGALFFGGMVVLLCFSPQPDFGQHISTPGIVTYGRLIFLPTLFNSFVHLGDLDTPYKLFWVIGQNVVNIFLLTPFVFCLLGLCHRLRSYGRIALVSFGLSLGIECGQLLLDALFDFNRVFELDDLWTNTLGGIVALVVFKGIQRYV